MCNHDPHPCYQATPRFGSVWLHHPDDGYVADGEYVGQKQPAKKTVTAKRDPRTTKSE
jgi:hypothetical protein